MNSTTLVDEPRDYYVDIPFRIAERGNDERSTIIAIGLALHALTNPSATETSWSSTALSEGLRQPRGVRGAA